MPGTDENIRLPGAPGRIRTCGLDYKAPDGFAGNEISGPYRNASKRPFVWAPFPVRQPNRNFGNPSGDLRLATAPELTLIVAYTRDAPRIVENLPEVGSPQPRCDTERLATTAACRESST